MKHKVMCNACGEYFYEVDQLERCTTCAKQEDKLDLHPMQQIRLVNGVARFRENKIIRFLLATHPTVDLNHIAAANFSREDRIQMTQLIGYSVSGAGDLSTTPVRVATAADQIVERALEKQGITTDSLLTARKAGCRALLERVLRPTEVPPLNQVLQWDEDVINRVSVWAQWWNKHGWREWWEKHEVLVPNSDIRSDRPPIPRELQHCLNKEIWGS
jgi:hypothetical protein